MRSLFLKIFLWYWATVLLVGLAVASVWALQPEMIVSRWRAATSEAITIYAQSAAEEFDRFGLAPLNNYFQRLRTTSRIRAALLDENGALIAGDVPEPAVTFARQAVPNGQPQFELHLSMAYAEQRATGPSGRTYIFVAEMPRNPLGGAFRPGASLLSMRWGVAILVSGLICYALTAYLSRPVLRLSTAARQIAAGDLSARADASMERRADEIGTLVHDFNQMAARMEELIKSNRQLISDISHELRSPLARLGVALGLARQRAGDAASAQLDRIELEGERLNELIGRLLELARMQGTNELSEAEPVSMRELISDVGSDAAFEAQEKNCIVSVDAPTDCLVRGNPELLRSAVENVVRNAVRYSPENKSISISLTCEETAGRKLARIRVRDHGPGLPEQELSKVFQPFYRVATARDRQSGGTGLGLAITERAVLLHSGSVQARNAEDGGLIVELVLPVQRG